MFHYYSSYNDDDDINYFYAEPYINNEIDSTLQERYRQDYNDLIKSIIIYKGYYMSKYKVSLKDDVVKSVEINEENDNYMTSLENSGNTAIGMYDKISNMFPSNSKYRGYILTPMLLREAQEKYPDIYNIELLNDTFSFYSDIEGSLKFTGFLKDYLLYDYEGGDYNATRDFEINDFQLECEHYENDNYSFTTYHPLCTLAEMYIDTSDLNITYVPKLRPACTVTCNKAEPISNRELIYTFTWNEDVFGFTEEDIQITNSTIVEFREVIPNRVYKYRVKNHGYPDQEIYIQEGSCINNSGIVGEGVYRKYEISRKGPTLISFVRNSLVDIDERYKKASYTITFDKPVVDFDLRHLSIYGNRKLSCGCVVSKSYANLGRIVNFVDKGNIFTFDIIYDFYSKASSGHVYTHNYHSYSYLDGYYNSISLIYGAYDRYVFKDNTGDFVYSQPADGRWYLYSEDISY